MFRLWVTISLLFLLHCTDTHFLTGSYRSEYAVSVNPIDGFHDVYMELVLGQYGSEVAGLIRFFGNQDFTLPPDVAKGCDCILVQKGVYSSNVLKFVFDVPFPCNNVNPVTVSAKLEVQAGGKKLKGRLYGEGFDVDITFVRFRDETELIEADKKCDRYSL